MKMPPRVLFVPGWLVSAGACEKVTGISAALAEFRKRFQVDVYHWPWMVGGRREAASWEGVLDDLRGAMGRECHVVAMGAATGNLLLALRDHEDAAATLTCAGFSVPPGTLRALGLMSVAGAAAAMFRWQSNYQYVRLVMAGADEQTWTSVAHAMDADVDWSLAARHMEKLEELDLEAERVRLSSVQTLYLDSPLQVAGYAEMTEIFLRFVPQARVEELKIWPGRLQDRESGLDLSGTVIPFIDAAIGATPA